MIKSKLGNTSIEVSKICLGTMTWGEQNNETDAHQQLDYALERGVNFIDTAEMYPVPPRAETYTKTETIIGHWSKLKTNRDQIILATKIAGPSSGMTHVREGLTQFKRKHLVEAFENSLKRLQTDYIDLYQLHWPERQTNFFGQLSYHHITKNEDITPFHETLEVLSEFIKAGKLRAIGLSNETPWGAMKFLEAADKHALPRMVSIQNPYSLLNRTFEIGLSEIALREHLGLLAYSPLGFGVLTGKYLNNQKPSKARITLFERFSRYTNVNGKKATQKYVELAQSLGISPAQMALSFVNSRPFVTSNIIGATSMDQLKENIDSIELKLGQEILQEIDSIHQDIPNPCP